MIEIKYAIKKVVTEYYFSSANAKGVISFKPSISEAHLFKTHGLASMSCLPGEVVATIKTEGNSRIDLGSDVNK